MSGIIDVRGLVYHGPGRPTMVEDLRLDPPGSGEVRVRMVAAGVCHSDLHVVDAEWERPSDVVLGHEGAAVVESLGLDVLIRPPDAAPSDGGLRVGDLVSLAWTAPCGACVACSRGEAWLCQDPRGPRHRLDPGETRLRRRGGEPIGVYSGIGTFCTAQVVAQEAAIVIDPRTPHGVAALIGCAASTGVGAVRNTAAVAAGQSVAVIGLGGVGLAALLAAVDAGAEPVIGVDLERSKLELARELGATATTYPDSLPGLAATLPGTGLDHVFECIGLPSTVELALTTVRPGGTVILVGMTEMGMYAQVDVYRFVEDGIRLLGSNYGSCVPARDFPAIAADALAGRLPLGRSITEQVDLDGVGAAFEAMRRRSGGRRIVDFPG